MKNKIPIGIMLFGLYFIIDSLIQLCGKLMMPNYYYWYSSLFRPLPKNIIFLRYLLSVIFRIVELIAGIGILLRKEVFRKLALFISWFVIAIVYWKHPFDALAKNASRVIESSGCYELTLPSNTRLISWLSLACAYAFDIGVSIATIYYFTRPYIKERFRHRGS